ncbi:uncharacterized protein DS421_3g96500 [Arachis hypogaea]|nr:uncharacterized protein DS421_3g96500 [Arachis hypogaea]
MGLATISYMSDEMDPKLTGESLTTISIIPPAKWRTAHHWRQQRNGDIKGGACKMEHPASGIHELGHICCSAHKMTKPMAAATKWCRFVVNAASFRLLQSSTNMHWPARVLTPHGTLVDVFTSEPPDPSMDVRRQRLELYLRQARFYCASLIKRFEYDNPLISPFIERWRSETHTFHLPWGVCTITLEDVAMQLGLPIDGEPISGTLRSWNNFHQRDIWQWCQELLGDVPVGHYACCYILYLLGGMLLPDKANNTVHVQYLSLLVDFDAISTYSWGSACLCWLYRAMLSFWAPEVATLYSFPLATRWAGKKGHNNYAEQCLLRHRLRLDNLQVDEFNWLPYMEPRILSRVPAEFLGAPHRDFYTSVVPLILFWWIEILNIDRVLRQFGGKQGLLNPPLVARTPVNLV